jgi:hypothetical protein
MAIKEHIEQPTTTVSATAMSAVAAIPTTAVYMKGTFFNLTRSTRDLFRFPLRIVTTFDRIVSDASHRFLGTSSRVAGASMMAEAAQAAGGQQAVPLGWRRAFGEALSLSNTRSYWGMLHYVTSRWAFVTFSLVFSTTKKPCWVARILIVFRRWY